VADNSQRLLKFEREVILDVGKTGHGKTLWARRYITHRRRVIILDPMLEYEGRLFDDLREMLDYCQSNEVYQVRSEHAVDAPDLCKIAMYCGRCIHPQEPMPHKGCTDVCIVIDEAGRAIPSRTLLDPSIEDVIYQGRHRHVTMVNVAQRSSTLSIAARSQWTKLISFWQTEPADVKWVQDQSGEKLPVDDLTPLEYFEVTPLGVKKKRIPVGHDRRVAMESSDEEVNEHAEVE